MGGLTEEQCDQIVSFAEHESERLEAEQRKRRVLEKSQFTSTGPSKLVPPSEPTPEPGDVSVVVTPEVNGEVQPTVVLETVASELSEEPLAASEEASEDLSV